MRQWRTRRGAEFAGLQRHLVTYRPSPGHPGRYQVLISNPDELMEVISGRQRGLPQKWSLIGEFTNSRSQQLIPLTECPPRLGQLLERQTRERYAAWVGLGSLPGKNPNTPGLDAQHEYVAFLRELAAELEAEISASS